MNNDNYNITQDFENSSVDVMHSFLLLTRYINYLQQLGRFNILNMEGSGIQNIFNNYQELKYLSNEQYNSLKYYFLPQIYNNSYDLYIEMKNILTETERIENLNPIFEEHLNTQEQRENFTRFLKLCVLINLIRNRTRNKTYQDVHNYSLINKINYQPMIEHNCFNSLCIGNIEVFNDYHIYDNLFTDISDDTYDRIYNAFYNFR